MYRKEELEKAIKNGREFAPVMADGIEVYCLKDTRAKFPDFEELSHRYHLQMRVIIKDSATDNEWHLTKYSPKGCLQVDHIIRNFVEGGKYRVISFDHNYKRIADRLLERAATSGSAVDVKRVYEDIAAVEALFKDEKIGYGKSMQLVVNDDTLEHIYVPNTGNSITFKNITLAYCLIVPTDDMARKALGMIKDRKQVPSVIGMMPEDVADYAKRNNIELNYECILTGEDEDITEEGAFYGPYVILDHENDVGYALRYTYDGMTFFWAQGSHFNLYLVDNDKVHQKGMCANVDISQLRDHDVMSWKPITNTVESDNYGGLTCVE